ncbi:MAG: CHAD domain-containing protein [Planctomycetota bacterium]
MAVRDLIHEHLGVTLSAEAKRRLRHARRLAPDATRGDAGAIRLTRRCLNRTRSLIRLLPKDDAHRCDLDRVLREASHTLGEQRDLRAAAERALELRGSAKSKKERRALRHVAKALRRRERTRAAESASPIVCRAIDRVLRELPPMLEERSDGEIRRQIRASYDSASRARRRAERARTDDTLHRWRRRARHLRNQLEAMPAHADRAFTRRLRRLTRGLGFVNDLAVLEALISHPGVCDRETLPRVRHVLDRERRSALKTSRRRGERLFTKRRPHLGLRADARHRTS